MRRDQRWATGCLAQGERPCTHIHTTITPAAGHLLLMSTFLPLEATTVVLTFLRALQQGTGEHAARDHAVRCLQLMLAAGVGSGGAPGKANQAGESPRVPNEAALLVAQARRVPTTPCAAMPSWCSPPLHPPQKTASFGPIRLTTAAGAAAGGCAYRGAWAFREAPVKAVCCMAACMMVNCSGLRGPGGNVSNGEQLEAWGSLAIYQIG